jgi:hypothetical protein
MLSFALVRMQVKLSGVMDNCSVFDQLATVREVDLYGLWMPFVAASTLVAQIGKVELLDYFEVTMIALCVHSTTSIAVSAMRVYTVILASVQ